MTRIIIALLLSITSYASAEAEPHLAFTDLISGPQYGIGDSLGEGAIVTLWGYRFGEQPGEIWLTDAAGNRHQAAHIYYWTKANGELPGGPADLWRSHNMYEVAFSLPSSLPDGLNQIELVTADNIAANNELPFTTRPGNIYHVKEDGDGNNAGTFDAPWRMLSAYCYGGKAAGNGRLKAGDITYSHGVREVQEENECHRGTAGMWLVQLEGTAEKQIAVVSYPNTQVFTSGPNWGVAPYLSTGIVVSKFRVASGHIPDQGPGAPVHGVANPRDSNSNVRGSPWGRIVGNHLFEREGMCGDGWSGAIVAAGDGADGLVAYGNHIFDHGCDQTSHFQHTTYITIRDHAVDEDGNRKSQLAAFDFGWNFLEDNKAKFGIHFYDQLNYGNDECRSFKPGEVLKVHNNVIINQKGSGINVHNFGRAITLDDGSKVTNPCWQVDTQIFNNVIINSGLGPVGEENNGTAPYAITAGGDIAGHFDIFNNTIIDVSDDSSRNFIRAGNMTYNEPDVIAISSRFVPSTFDVYNNVVSIDYPMPYVSYWGDFASDSRLSVDHNLWYNRTTETVSPVDTERFINNLPAHAEFNNPQLTRQLPMFITSAMPQHSGGRKEGAPKYDLYGVTIGNDVHRGAASSYGLPQPGAPTNFVVEKIE